MMERIRQAVLEYTPFNEQEERDKQLMLSLMTSDDVLLRSSEAAHLTASAWVVNKAHDNVLMAYHLLYDSWAWLGGHADGNADLLAVACKEVKEESGLTDVAPVSNAIFSLEVLTVDGHEKRERYVSSHLHLNVTYLLEADDTLPLQSKADENKAVAWFTPEEALAHSSEPWFVERIYAKLIAKTNRFFQDGAAV